ncbi:MAG: hypothetical protein Kow0080_14520 [Candidatus Promineifilaceae bacterium]
MNEKTESRLQEGIAALRAGDKAKARALLMAVLEDNERHEQAWLWLSGAVDSVEERQICLENILAINPQNEQAKRGLAKLQKDAPETAVIQSQHQPLSPASAILHPDRYEPQAEERTIVYSPAQQVTYTTTSKFDDVWTGNDDICAYCAHVVPELTTKCPSCKRPLIQTQYRYPNPGVSLHLYWVILIAAGQLFLLKAIFYIIVEKSTLPVLTNSVLIVLFLILGAGIYFRQLWAYYLSLAALCILFLITLTTFFSPLALSSLGVMQLDPAISQAAGSFIYGFATFLDIFLFTTITIGLILGIIQVGPDFEQTKVKLLATVVKGLVTATDYSVMAHKLAERGLWASAVLHWQRAAAKEPTNWQHQRNLGTAYARLGFYERALDALQSATKFVTNPQNKKELEQLITAVSQQVAR